MARKAKIDNSVLKRLAREEKGRSVDTRKKRKYFLIVCEGEKTEPNYFAALKNDLPEGVLSLYNFEIDGTGMNTSSLVDYTIQKKDRAIIPYDEIWVVFDRDSFRSAQFNTAINRANANGINAAWSNEAFELWYLLHFNYHDTGINRRQYRTILNREISAKLGQPFVYAKNHPSMYSLLKEIGNQKLAIRYASAIHRNWNNQQYDTHNPCTTVYLLIRKLCSLSMDEHCIK